MKLLRCVRSLVFSIATLLGLGVALPGNAGIEVKQFSYFKSGPSSSVSFTDQFDAGGPLVNPGAPFQWIGRKGMFEASDENMGLYLNSLTRGELFSIGPYQVTGQVMQLDAAINNELGAFFGIFAVYEWNPYPQDNLSVGIGLTDAFHGGSRAIAVGTSREGGMHYSKLFNPLTGDVIAREELVIPTGTVFLEYFINRENPVSDSVISGYGFRDSFGALIGSPRFLGLSLAFSDVVLYPVLFSALLVPEAETWTMIIVGLGLVAWQLRRRSRNAASQYRG